MSKPPSHLRSSRQRYLRFVYDYRRGRLDDQQDAKLAIEQPPASQDEAARDTPWYRGERREYLREYLRWLWPHRYRVGLVFLLALTGAGLQMIEPLFMRYIIDRVLLNAGLDAAERIDRLHLAGGLFVAVVIVTQLVNVLKDYRQRLLNTRVMLSLRQAFSTSCCACRCRSCGR